MGRRGLWLPLAALGLAAAGLWWTGALDRPAAVSAEAAAPPEDSITAKGVRFGLCDQGGGTNCVASGDSFYLQGKSVRIAGIEAPSRHDAACEAEALLGRAAATGLTAMLNSGAVTLIPAGDGIDPNGRLLRTVSVDGQEVGAAMVAEGFARKDSGADRPWC